LYCKAVGIDPDKKNEKCEQIRVGGWSTRSKWKDVAEDLKKFEVMREAIETAKKTNPPLYKILD
jgi:hypothetical protein